MDICLTYSEDLKYQDIQETLDNFNDPWSQITVSLSDGNIGVNSLLLTLNNRFFTSLFREHDNYDRLIIPDFDIQTFERYIDLIKIGKTGSSYIEEWQDVLYLAFHVLRLDEDQFTSEKDNTLKNRLISSFSVRDGNSPTTCQYCLYRFKTKQSRKQHEKTCQKNIESEEVYECSECGKKYLTEQGLHAHITSKHEHLGPFKCLTQTCKKEYKNLQSLVRHCQSEKHRFPNSDDFSN